MTSNKNVPTLEVGLENQMTKQQQSLINKAAALVESASKAAIKTERDEQDAVDLIKLLRSTRQQIDAERKSYTDHLEAVKKKIIAQFKVYLDPLDAALKSMNDMLTEAVNARTQQAAEEPDEVPGKEVAPIVGGYTGARSSTRTRWLFRAKSIRFVPAKYVQLDEVALRGFIQDVTDAGKKQALAEGLRGSSADSFVKQYVDDVLKGGPVRGVEFYQETKQVVR